MKKVFPALFLIAASLAAQDAVKEKPAAATPAPATIPAATPAPQTAPAVSPERAAKTYVAEDTFDAGRVTKGRMVEHVFVVRNMGKSDLEILSAKPSCGCTVATFDKKILPGGEGKITANFDTSHFKGSVGKTILVTTDDPQKDTFILTLKATIVTYMDIAPDAAYIRTFEGEKGGQILELKPAQDKSFTIQKMEVDNPKLKYTLTPPVGTAIAKDQRVKLALEVPADTPPGNIQGMIKVTTNIAEQPEVDIPYTLNVQKLITITPAQVLMNVSLRPYKIEAAAAVNAMAEPSPTTAQAGKLDAGKEYPVSDVQRGWAQVRFPDAKLGWVELAKVKPTYGGTQNAIWVSKHQGPPPAPAAGAAPAVQPPPSSGNDPAFKVTDVKADLAFLKLSIVPKQAGAFLVNIVYEGPLEEKSFHGAITLTTNDAKEPEIQVPIQITVGQTAPQRQHPAPGRPELKPIAPPPPHPPIVNPGEGK